MRVVSLHSDVVLATSAIWQTNCVLVCGRGEQGPPADPGAQGDRLGGMVDETFLIDSPVLPEELEALPALLEQSRFPAPSGLLVTHADWDHLLAPLAFPDATLGCAESTAERMGRRPGDPQRGLRDFDEEHYIERPRPLALGSVQALEVPGRCEIGARELELHAADGHTADGMAVWIGFAAVLVAGDYLSATEIPVLGEDGSIDSYLNTLERLRALIASADHVVPGHGPTLGPERAGAVLEEDVAYLSALREVGSAAELPLGRRTKRQRAIHGENVTRSSRS